MADLEEVLAKMDLSDYLYDTAQFVIDKDLRTTVIPAEGAVLGVTGDNNVNRVNFKMERYYDGNDLSEFAIRISYKNANGDSNFYDVNEYAIENDRILFTWLVSSDAVAYAGTVYFTVRLFIMDNSDPTKIVKSFNTALISATVIQGMYVDEGITPEDQHDVIAQIIETTGVKRFDERIKANTDEILKLKDYVFNTVKNTLDALAKNKAEKTEVETKFNSLQQQIGDINDAFKLIE